MSEPLVCAVCLVNGRESMVKRAVASFRAQTYERKCILILDSGWPRVPIPACEGMFLISGCEGDLARLSVGRLRNTALVYALDPLKADIICHFDSDDWSHPNRIAEQVALLQSSAGPRKCPKCLGSDSRFKYHNGANYSCWGCNLCGREFSGAAPA